MSTNAERRHREGSRSARALSTVSFLIFGAGSVALGVLLHQCGQRPDLLRRLGTDLPLPTQWLLELAETMTSFQGMVIAAGAVLLLSLPFLMGARGQRAAQGYGVLALATVFAHLAAWWFLVRPIGLIAEVLNAAPR